MREAMMRTIKPFVCRRRRELVLIGAAVCALGIVTSTSVRAADLDIGPGYPGGYQEHPYPYPPYPPHVQNYPLYEGPTIYYPPHPRYYRPYASADPDVGYGYGYGRPRYFYPPYPDRPPAPIPFAAYPRDLPPPNDTLAEESPGYGWQPSPGW
jgi:hypothetical protein